jgi:predicted DCC family thiol-disulfide oxidoreductase YuxK
LLNPDQPTERWQGSAAAEEIGRRLPLGNLFIQTYRALPGMKPLGDRVYEQVRDNRYDWFGRRDRTYQSTQRFCQTKTCPDLKAELH